MPSSSSIRWTVSSNMMYRFLLGNHLLWLFSSAAALIAVCSLLLLQPLPATAAEQCSLPGESNILLLHPDTLTDDQMDSLRILADTATALNMSMELGTPAQADGLYDHYSLILVYDLDADTALAQHLSASGAKLMILGGAILPDCLKASGFSDAAAAVQKRCPSTSAVLSYDFTDQKSYQAVTLLPELIYTAKGGTEYEAGSLDVSGQAMPFCTGFGSIRYIPLTDYTQTLPRAAIAFEISTWLWDYSGLPPQKGQYIVLDNVYAYMPAQDLLDRVDILIQSGLPFVICVMPVYVNTDYPAMQQFCEVLRYAQANGGAVILHVPITRTAITDWDAYNATITEVLGSYTAQAVYPLAFDVPYSWTWSTDALQWMQRSRTIFVYEDSAQTDFSADTQQNLLFYNYNALVLPTLTLNGNEENCIPMISSSRRLSVNEDIADLQELVSSMQTDASSYYSLWDSNQSVWANGFHLNWSANTLTLNNVPCSLTYTPQTAAENYDYKRNTLQRFTVSIQNESHFLIILVSIITMVFLLMIVYARHVQREHFLPQNTPLQDGNENSRDIDCASQYTEVGEVPSILEGRKRR